MPVRIKPQNDTRSQVMESGGERGSRAPRSRGGRGPLHAEGLCRGEHGGPRLARRPQGCPRVSCRLLLGPTSAPAPASGRDAAPRMKHPSSSRLSSDASQEHEAQNCHLVPCSVPLATCWHRPKDITEQGGESAIPGPLRSSEEEPAGSSRGHGSGEMGEIRSSLRLPTPNPFATFRVPEAIGSGRRKGVPRAGAGASGAQPKVGGRGCAKPKRRALQTPSPSPRGSRLPPARCWTHARWAVPPRGLRSGGDGQPRSEDGLPQLWQLFWKPGSQQTARLRRRQSRCPAPRSLLRSGCPQGGRWD